MSKLDWINYSPDTTKEYKEIQERLSKLSLEFSRSKPMIVRKTFNLPKAGQILPIGQDKFVLKCTERVQEFEQGYWVGRGTPGYGQEWIPSSQADSYLDDDDRFFLRERMIPAGYRDETEYFYGGVEKDELVLREIDVELVSELEVSLESFLEAVAKREGRLS